MVNIKVNFFDRRLISRYLCLLSIISILLSFILIAVTIPDEDKLTVGLCIFVALLILYIFMWLYANYSERATLHINNSTIHVKVGDIFKEDDKNELKVIAFNEYFDTVVDNRIIAEGSLNGKFIRKKINSVSEFDEAIYEDQELNDKMIGENSNRPKGKKYYYRLGSIYQHEDYLLTSFSKFDKNNKAYLNMNDYINFLINFWNEVDIVYAGRTVIIPLLGSGMTRFKGYETVSEQELLELLIWSFKVSRIKFKHPAHVSIIIHESTKEKINFYKLRSVENGL